MKVFGNLFSKFLIITTMLVVTISLAIIVTTNSAIALKNNIVVVIVLLANQNPITSDLYQQLMDSSNNIIAYVFGILFLINLTVFIPVIFIKEPFSKAVLSICMIIITLVLTLLVATFYNFFNTINFESVAVNHYLIIPFVGLGLVYLSIFWYGLRNLWVNPAKKVVVKSSIYKKQIPTNNKLLDNQSYENLQAQLRTLKKQLKEVRHIKTKKP